MNLLRALYSEHLKLKRTTSWQIVLLAPLLIVSLMFVYFYLQSPHLTLRGWPLLERPALTLWAVVVMPLYITIVSALIAGLDHSGNQWKSLFVRPVPRWTFYVAKLAIIMAMLAVSTVVLLCGILLDGTVVSRLRSDVLFGSPIPWSGMLRECAQVTCLSFLALTMQYWVSMRWRSFSVAFAFGVMAAVFGAFAFAVGRQIGGWLQYLPWALPLLPLADRPSNLGGVLWFSTIAGLAVTAAGCWDFRRREVP